jgi:hypothetical protein
MSLQPCTQPCGQLAKAGQQGALVDGRPAILVSEGLSPSAPVFCVGHAESASSGRQAIVAPAACHTIPHRSSSNHCQPGRHVQTAHMPHAVFLLAVNRWEVWQTVQQQTWGVAVHTGPAQMVMATACRAVAGLHMVLTNTCLLCHNLTCDARCACQHSAL